ncbi:Nitrogen permease regulator 2 [Phlyctochytrium planicorne]|nr:Nitrogen permease regulator 2 [Phlyctochytrium planicorne]
MPPNVDDYADRKGRISVSEWPQTASEPASYRLNVPKNLNIRIGIKTGAVCAAVLGGKRKIRYDLIGDTIELATALEQECEPGKIHVCSRTAKEVENQGALEKGPLEGTFYICSLREVE